MFLDQDDRVYARSQVTVRVLIAVLEYHLPAYRPALHRVAGQPRPYRGLLLAAERQHSCTKTQVVGCSISKGRRRVKGLLTKFLPGVDHSGRGIIAREIFQIFLPRPGRHSRELLRPAT